MKKETKHRTSKQEHSEIHTWFEVKQKKERFFRKKVIYARTSVKKKAKKKDKEKEKEIKEKKKPGWFMRNWIKCHKWIFRKCCAKCLKKNAVYMMPSFNMDTDEKKERAMSTFEKIKSKIIHNSAEILFKNKSANFQDPSIPNIGLLSGHNASELKRKFSIKGSKGYLLDDMVNQYKKGLLSGLNTPPKTSKSKQISKSQLNTMLSKYSTIKKRKNLDAEALQKKYKVYGSDRNVLKNLLDDYKQGKVSLKGITNKPNKDVNKMSQKEFQSMLTKYKATKMAETRKSSIKDKYKNFMEVSKFKYY